MGTLEGKVALITGGSRGIGFAIAEAMAAEGAAICITSRSQQQVDTAVQKLQAQGAKTIGMATDVADLVQVKALAEFTLNTLGHIDIWVNNAGTGGPYGPTLDFTPEAFQRVIDTNIMGVYYGSRTAMRIFLAQKSGKLINLLGHGDNGPVAFQNAYASSKAWVRSFTLCLAQEYKGSGVDIFAFNPGMVLTDLLTNLEVYDGSQERLKIFPKVVRILAKPPAEPAKKVVWLASDAGRRMAGKRIAFFSFPAMLAGALKEWLHPPKGADTIQTKVIPPAKD